MKRKINITNRIAIINANLLYPKRLISLSVVPPHILPRAATSETVIIAIKEEPTPAQERANAERDSRSLPLCVKAGTIDQ